MGQELETYKNVKKIKQLENIEEVNKYLENDWFLINTFIVDNGEPQHRLETVYYTIGTNNEKPYEIKAYDPYANQKKNY
ncbi:MAG: hypothetical protein PHC46_01855 [Clostridia bacterium]|nr:hypothetical protein [Clostridia bacterium]